MQSAKGHSIDHQSIQEQRRYYRIVRQFSTQRQFKELMCDLLRAHCGT